MRRYYMLHTYRTADAEDFNQCRTLTTRRDADALAHEYVWRHGAGATVTPVDADGNPRGPVWVFGAVPEWAAREEGR